MYLTDYHTHSVLSFDGHAPLCRLAGTAVAAGLQELCITDHCDLLDEDGNRANSWSCPPPWLNSGKPKPAIRAG